MIELEMLVDSGYGLLNSSVLGAMTGSAMGFVQGTTIKTGFSPSLQKIPWYLGPEWVPKFAVTLLVAAAGLAAVQSAELYNSYLVAETALAAWLCERSYAGSYNVVSEQTAKIPAHNKHSYIGIFAKLKLWSGAKE